MALEIIRQDITKVSADVIVNTALNLKAKYIIHAVGPIWQGGSKNEFEVLRSCYKKSLELAAEKNCTSIAFPLISTGNNGFPHESAMLVATATIQKFMGIDSK